MTRRVAVGSAGNTTSVFLLIGRAPLLGADIFRSSLSDTVFATVNNIPTDGRTIYVMLASRANNTWMKSYTYKAFKQVNRRSDQKPTSQSSSACNFKS